MTSRRILPALAFGLTLCRTAGSQELDADPNRIFTTGYKWERVAGASHNEKLRYARGTLVVLYLEGVYAEVTASFIKTNEKRPVGLNLNEGFIVRLGTWSRTDDDTLIRIESREVMREKQIQKLSCKAASGDRVCTAMPEPSLPGPLISHTCRLERQSPTHIAETIVCNGGLVVSHQQKMLDLVDFPDLVRRLVLSQRREYSNK
jgi:hypothetical protein